MKRHVLARDRVVYDVLSIELSEGQRGPWLWGVTRTHKQEAEYPYFRQIHTYGLVSAYLTDSLRPTSEFVARHLHSADTTTLLVPPTRRVTLGDRAFPVTAAWAWNSLPAQIRAASSLLSFRRQTKAHLFQLSYN